MAPSLDLNLTTFILVIVALFGVLVLVGTYIDHITLPSLIDWLEWVFQQPVVIVTPGVRRDISNAITDVWMARIDLGTWSIRSLPGSVRKAFSSVGKVKRDVAALLAAPPGPPGPGAKPGAL